MPTLMEVAYTRDHYNNEYFGEPLLLLMLLRSTGGERTLDKEREVGKILDDPNQTPAHKGHRR